MPKFYFDVRRNNIGLLAQDDEGQQLPNLNAAEREAVDAGTEMARELTGSGDTLSVVVRDARKRHVLTATVTLEVDRLV